MNERFTAPGQPSGTVLCADFDPTSLRSLKRKLIVSDEFAGSVPENPAILWLSFVSGQPCLCVRPPLKLDGVKHYTGPLLEVSALIVGPDERGPVTTTLLPLIRSAAGHEVTLVEARDGSEALRAAALAALDTCSAAEIEASALASALASMRRQHRLALSSIDRARVTLNAHGLNAMTTLRRFRSVDGTIVSCQGGLVQKIPAIDEHIDEICIFPQSALANPEGSSGLLTIQLVDATSGDDAIVCELAVPGTHIRFAGTIPTPKLGSTAKENLYLRVGWTGTSEHAPKFMLAANPYADEFALRMADQPRAGWMIAMEFRTGIPGVDQQPTTFLVRSSIDNSGWRTLGSTSLSTGELISPEHPDYGYSLVVFDESNLALLVHPPRPGEETWFRLPGVLDTGVERVTADVSLNAASLDAVEFALQAETVEKSTQRSRPCTQAANWTRLEPGDASVVSLDLVGPTQELRSLLLGTRMRCGAKANGSAHARFERIRLRSRKGSTKE